MTYEERSLPALSRLESVALLARSHVGRAVFTERALPAVATVPFAFHNAGIVMHTSGDSRLASAAARGSILAFEIDDIDPGTRTGWSVVVLGEPELVTAGEERAVIEHLLEAWVPGVHDACIRLALTVVTGRRIDCSGQTPTTSDQSPHPGR
jgi:Predicted flavin-nucleotide-binding protein